jgi:AhpD family alkylhydroperoxidase
MTDIMSRQRQVAFPDHTIDSAPPAARRSMTAIREHWGYLPSGAARLASSPHALDGFLRLNVIFEGCTLDPVAREVVIMTIATRNGCHLCVAIHTQRLTALGADAGLVADLRNKASLKDERLAAIQTFTDEILDSAGAVGDDALRTFFAHGYTRQNALEVVLGIGTYTLSTLANRLTGAPLDPPLAPYAWTP